LVSRVKAGLSTVAVLLADCPSLAVTLIWRSVRYCSLKSVLAFQVALLPVPVVTLPILPLVVVQSTQALVFPFQYLRLTVTEACSASATS